jgi:hypothetical protein
MGFVGNAKRRERKATMSKPHFPEGTFFVQMFPCSWNESMTLAFIPRLLFPCSKYSHREYVVERS